MDPKNLELYFVIAMIPLMIIFIVSQRSKPKQYRLNLGPTISGETLGWLALIVCLIYLAGKFLV
jgi:hypothetical protein